MAANFCMVEILTTAASYGFNFQLTNFLGAFAI
jgi:hypothetical protein